MKRLCLPFFQTFGMMKKKTGQAINRRSGHRFLTVIGISRKKILSVEDDSLRNLISFKIEVKEPELARAWAAAYVNRLNEYIKAQKAEDVDKTISFLKDKLADTSIVEVRRQLTSMLVTQIKQQMLMNVYDDYAFEILDPAIASDPEDYAYPNHLIWTALGLILGVFLAYALSLWRRLTA